MILLKNIFLCVNVLTVRVWVSVCVSACLGLGPPQQWGLLPVMESGLIFCKHLLNPLSYRTQDNETGMKNPSMHACTHTHIHTQLLFDTNSPPILHTFCHASPVIDIDCTN